MSGVTAQIAWLEGPQQLVWREAAVRAPAQGEVLCETVVSALSPGTELAAWRGAAPLRPGNPYPRVQGYCNVAKVLGVGDGLEAIAVGDHVLSLQSHRSHFICPASDIYYVMPRDAGADPGAVATSYLFHLGYNAVLRSDVRPGHRVAVIGLGALGLTSVAMAHLAGAEVTAISDHARPLALATHYGAQRALTRAQMATQDSSSAADITILTTNGWADFALAQRQAAQNGVIACLGFPGRDQPPGDYQRDYNPLAAAHFYTKQLRIEAVGMSPLDNDPRGFARFNLRDNLGFIANAIASGRIDPAPLVSGRYPAQALEQAYRDLAARKDDAVTYLLDWT